MNAPAVSASACFHCGEPLPSGAHWPVRVQGHEQQTCCPGCQAACESIVALGLENYYQHRDRYSARVGDSAVPENLFANFTDASMVDGGYVADAEDGSRECTLIVEDLRCAACGWLIEKSLNGLPGVRQSSVNVTSGRVRVRWQPGSVELRDILLRVRKLGYRVLPFRDGQRGSRLDVERRASLLRLVVAGFGMMQVMHVAVGFYWDAADSMGIAHRDYLRVISAIITMPVVFYSGFPFLRNAWNSMRAGVPAMDVPVALAILLAYFASLWAVMVEGPEVWFDSVVMFVFFLLLGRHLELEARRRAMSVIDNLSASLPLIATRVRDGVEEIVPAGQVRVGEIVKITPGEIIPLDGVVIDGRGHVNEAMLTGESQPVMRQTGDRLTGGCTSIDGIFRVEVMASASGGRLSRIVDLVNRAQADKPALQELADRIAVHFVWALLLLTLLTWAAWHVIDPDRAFWVALAVLVVSCPCALSLATPAAHTVATNLLTGRGMLLTRGRVLSTLPGLRAVVFDKTGTLTQGRPVIREIKLHADLPEARALAIAAALEMDSEHPLARAFRSAASVTDKPAADVRVVPGAGIEGTVDGVRYRIGSHAWVTAASFTETSLISPVDDGARVWLADSEAVLASFLIGDGTRHDAKDTVRALQQQGIDVHLLSGDASGEAAHLAGALGIRHVRAGASPEEKVEYLSELRKRLNGSVLMVGDGVNDAPVLAAADVSVAMGEGTDLARTAADAVLLRPQLQLIPTMMATAHAMRRTVRQNLGWALGYNIAMIPLAVFGFMPPWLAAIGMSASSLIVVLNALALKRRAARHSLYAAQPSEQTPAVPAA